MFLYRYRR